jgi:hypothetical protein
MNEFSKNHNIMNDEIELSYSRELLLKRWLRACPVSVLGWLLVWYRAPELWYARYGFILLFVMSTASFLRKGVWGGPQIRLTSLGLSDRRLRIGTLRWGCIENCKLHREYGATILLISVDKTALTTLRLSLFQRLMAKWFSLEDQCDLWINLSDIAVDSNDLLTIITERVSATKRAGG